MFLQIFFLYNKRPHLDSSIHENTAFKIKNNLMAFGHKMCCLFFRLYTFLTTFAQTVSSKILRFSFGWMCQLCIVGIGSGGSRPAVWEASEIGARQKALYLSKYRRLSVTVVEYHTKVVTFCRPRRWLFLFVELCDLSWNNHSSNMLYNIKH